ncbi:MAG: hypothetical protein M3Z17_03785 [Gemmatimonadota bacterium]|nr:hypothetical protein [Gemmatimonadota bacterium]
MDRQTQSLHLINVLLVTTPDLCRFGALVFGRGSSERNIKEDSLAVDRRSALII